MLKSFLIGLALAAIAMAPAIAYIHYGKSGERDPGNLKIVQHMIVI